MCPQWRKEPTMTPRGEARFAFLAITVIYICMATLPAVCMAGVAPSHLRTAPSTDPVKILFVGSAENDMFKILKSGSRFDVTRTNMNDAAAAILSPSTKAGGGVLFSSDNYPAKPVVVPAGVWDALRSKNMSTYIEYASTVPGTTVLGETNATTFERLVVTGHLGPSAGPMDIMVAHGCHYIPMTARNGTDAASLIVVSKVAGFRTAVYGLSHDIETYPILFEAQAPSRTLVGSTMMTAVRRGRYAPQSAWAETWGWILTWLVGETIDAADLVWSPSVGTALGKADPIPSGAELASLAKAQDFYQNSFLVPDVDALFALRDPIGRGVEEGPAVAQANGDGSLGILEGYSASVQHDGSQFQRYIFRSDCVAESAMVMAINDRSPDIAARLLDYIFHTSGAQVPMDPGTANDAMGFIMWGMQGVWRTATYGDDTARVLLASIVTSSMLKSDRWASGIVQGVLAAVRTSSLEGFRERRINLPDIANRGWQSYFTTSLVDPAPHYQSYLWACYLWAYQQTGNVIFKSRASSAIKLTMEAYPKGWKWANGITQERARMMLVLAWLIRVEDTEEHRGWMRRIAKDLHAAQDQSGAIRDEMGTPGQGSAYAPTSNRDYGTHEAPLEQVNGDAVSDMLYSCNFALLGLHEAHAATGEALYDDMATSLAGFLVRSQSHSTDHPELSGTWLRAFAYEMWEAWASSADLGWGAWSIETGWTGWIPAALHLRTSNSTLWELSSKVDMSSEFSRWTPFYLPARKE